MNKRKDMTETVYIDPERSEFIKEIEALPSYQKGLEEGHKLARKAINSKKTRSST